MARTRRARRTAGSIRWLPSGRYQARVRGDDGLLCPAPETFTTKADADRWVASMITDQAQGRWVDPRAGKVPLRTYAAEWLRGKAALSPKTSELYDYLLQRLVLPALGDVQLCDLSPARVRRWRADLFRAGRPGPSTIAKAYRLLSSMMATAVVNNLISRNPCQEKGAGVERAPEMRIITPEQVAGIAAAIDRRYRALVLTADYAGCRWGELAGLRQKNLDLADEPSSWSSCMVGACWCGSRSRTPAGAWSTSPPGWSQSFRRTCRSSFIRTPRGSSSPVGGAPHCARATSATAIGCRPCKPPAWRGCASTTCATSREPGDGFGRDDPRGAGPPGPRLARCRVPLPARARES